MDEEVKLNTVYTHYKGAKYLVLHVADESTNIRVPNKVVIYVSLTFGKIKVRDFSEFIEKVEWPDGAIRPRFVPNN